MNKNDMELKYLELGYYLAGLIEGDGNIWTQKQLRGNNGRMKNPQIMLTFHMKEINLYKHIKGILGGGCFYKSKNGNAFRYTVSDLSTLLKLINLVNGKFRTPKIIYLYRAIDYLNLRYNMNISKLPLDKSNINSNAWLAGMTDSDGCFHISIYTPKSRNVRIICSYTLTQRKIDEPLSLSCVPFMTEIANLFKCSLHYKKGNAITFIAQANSKHYLVKSYFDKFPLMSSKYLEYLCFLKGLNYLNKRLTEEEILEVKAVKNSMNMRRTFFSWDHLKNFYQ